MSIRPGVASRRPPDPAERRESPPRRSSRRGPAAGCRLVEAQRIAVEATADEHLEQVEAVLVTVGDQVLVRQFDWPLAFHDGLGRASDGTDPVRELGDVADRRREGDQANVVGQMDDHLFPDGTAVRVLEEVHLVDDHGSEVTQITSCIDHVAQHFGGHHDDRRVAVDRVVAGQQAHSVLAVDLDEVAILLVGERLDRCRVERSAPVDPVGGDAVLGDHGLATSGRCGDDDVAPRVERIEGLGLEAIGSERQPGEQLAAVRAHGHRTLRQLRGPGGDRRCSRSGPPGSTAGPSARRASSA